MYEDIKCEQCGMYNWTHEDSETDLKTGNKSTWLRCVCGHDQEVFTNKQLDEINRHKEE